MKKYLYYWHRDKSPVVFTFVDTVEELNRGLKNNERDTKTNAESVSVDETQAKNA